MSKRGRTIELYEPTSTLDMGHCHGSFLRATPKMPSESAKQSNSPEESAYNTTTQLLREAETRKLERKCLTFLPKVWTDCTTTPHIETQSVPHFVRSRTNAQHVGMTTINSNSPRSFHQLPSPPLFDSISIDMQSKGERQAPPCPPMAVLSHGTHV
jgi:hypothetical protein